MLNLEENSHRHDRQKEIPSSTDNTVRPNEALQSHWVAEFLKGEAADISRGNIFASEAALKEISNVRNLGKLGTVADELEKAGGTKILRGADGQPEHIIFNSADGQKPIDIDVKQQTINGQTEGQLKAATDQQAKEFLSAQLADPALKDSHGQPFSPEVKNYAGKLIGAVLEKNPEAIQKLGQEIMSDPKLMASVQEALSKVDVDQESPIKFKNKDGTPFMQVEGENSSLVVPNKGTMQAYRSNMGDPEWSEKLDIKDALKDAGDWEHFKESSMVEQAQNYLKMVNRLPKDGFTNMAGLEKAYSTPRHGEDEQAMVKGLIQGLQLLDPATKAQMKITIQEDKELDPAYKQWLLKQF